MASDAAFNYDVAIARNRGLVSANEQARLRSTCVALPGLGGVGGGHAQVLARMGLGSFKLADPDSFEVVNFNRQMGASMSSLGQNKAHALAEVVRNINPEATIETFPEGLTRENLDAFLSGVDVVVDGIDFFRADIRWMLYHACRRRNIPIVIAGPIAYGAAVLVAMPGGLAPEEFFGIREDMTQAEKILTMALGLAPGLVSDIDPASLAPERQEGPALASTCMLCSAAAGTEVLKIVLGRGRISAAPRGVYYDLYRGRTKVLRPLPALIRTLGGRVMRWLAFRRFPAFRAMHERELSERAAGGVVSPSYGQL